MRWIYTVVYTHHTLYVYNFRFLFVSLERLEPLLFFINSITFQFVWRDVVFFFCFFLFIFFSIFNFKIKIRILHMFHRLEDRTAMHRQATTTTTGRKASAEAGASAARGLCWCYKSFKKLALWQISVHIFHCGGFILCCCCVIHWLAGWFSRSTSHSQWDDREPHSH